MLFYSHKCFLSYFQRTHWSFLAFLIRNHHWCASPSHCRVPQYRRPSSQRELWAAGPDPGSALDQWKYSGLRWGPAAYHCVWVWCRSFLCQPADIVTLLWGQPLEQLYQRCNFYFTWHGPICQTLFGILTLPTRFFSPQASSRGPLPRVALLCPAGLSVFNLRSMLECWPARSAVTWRTQLSWCCASRGSITRSWWIKTSSQPVTTSPLDQWLMEMLYLMTLRS